VESSLTTSVTGGVRDVEGKMFVGGVGGVRLQAKKKKFHGFGESENQLR